MIPQLHQSIEDILKNATPELKIAYQNLRLIIGENAAIRQQYYTGPIALSEFLTYDANKLYFALKIQFSEGSFGFLSEGTVQFYDPANVLFFDRGNNSAYWDTPAAAVKFCVNSVDIENIIFSRIVQSRYAYMNFNGFKITY